MPDNFKSYRKRGVVDMRPYEKGEYLPSGLSISEVDRKNGSPKEGDMIARDPVNIVDKWLVAKDYFEKNYEPA